MKIICYLLGHKWSKWLPMAFDAKKDARHCIRCGKIQDRRVV